MGLTVSSTEEDLSFHPHCKGSFISLNKCLHEATRTYSFHDGLIFSNRTLRPRERFRIKVEDEEPRWHGALRVGFTSLDPSSIDVNSLPPFACPNLTVKPGFWAIGLPEELCQKGAELCFWVNRKGQAMCQEQGTGRPRVLFSGISTRTPLWVMLDVYGRTKSIKIVKSHTSERRSSPCSCYNKEHQEKGTRSSLPPTSPIYPLDHSQEKSPALGTHAGTPPLPFYQEDDPVCVICSDRLANTLLLPCRHCSFCDSCAVKVKRQNNLCPLCRQTITHTQNIGNSSLLNQSNS